jgi:hypothetical protein
VVVEHVNLAHGPRLLQFGRGLLLYPKNNDVVALHSHGSRPLAHCLQCILDLRSSETVNKGGASARESLTRCVPSARESHTRGVPTIFFEIEMA